MKYFFLLITLLTSLYALEQEEGRYHHQKSIQQRVVNQWVLNHPCNLSRRNNDHVKRLDFFECMLTSVDFLGNFRGVTSLNVSGNWQITSIQPLIHLPLKKLNLSICFKIRDYHLLASITSLQELELSCSFNDDETMSFYPSLDFLSPLVRLRKLDLSSNDSLPSLAPLRNLLNLTQLDLEYAKSVHDLSSLQGNTSLRFLNIHHTPMLSDLNFLLHIPNLRILVIGDKETTLPALSSSLLIYQ